MPSSCYKSEKVRDIGHLFLHRLSHRRPRRSDAVAAVVIITINRTRK